MAHSVQVSITAVENVSASTPVGQALLVAALVGFAAPLAGIVVAQRGVPARHSSAPTAALVGAAAATLTHAGSALVAIASAMIGAALFQWFTAKSQAPPRPVVAAAALGCVGAGVVMTATIGSTDQVVGLLSGSAHQLAVLDVAIISVVALGCAVALLALTPQLFTLNADPRYAQAMGLPVARLQLIQACLVAGTIAAAQQVVGLLFVAALVIFPVVVAQQAVQNTRDAIALAVLVGVVACMLGAAVALPAQWPAGGAIALVVAAVSGVVAGLAHTRGSGFIPPLRLPTK